MFYDTYLDQVMKYVVHDNNKRVEGATITFDTPWDRHKEELLPMLLSRWPLPPLYLLVLLRCVGVLNGSRRTIKIYCSSLLSLLIHFI